MQKRSSKRKPPSPDINEAAFNVIQAVLGAETGNPPLVTEEKPDAVKLLSSVALRRQIMREMGARGGRKGGKARAANLSDARLKAIAKKAAKARWSKRAE